MPTYVYACTECGHRFEQYQAFTDAALTECPECSSRLRKLFNNVGVVFKGSGFYRNDSRRNGSEAAPAADGGTKDGSGSKSGSDDAKVGAAKGSDAAASGSSGSGSSGSGSSGSDSSGSGSSEAGKSGATSTKAPVKAAAGNSAA